MKTEAEVKSEIQVQCDERGRGAVAKELNIVEDYLYQILADRRGVSKEIANKLGYKMVRKTFFEQGVDKD